MTASDWNQRLNGGEIFFPEAVIVFLAGRGGSPYTVTAYYYTLEGTCDYTYDDLARLGSDACGAARGQTFSYDAFGNIKKSGSQSFMPTYSSSTNQMTYT